MKFAFFKTHQNMRLGRAISFLASLLVCALVLGPFQSAFAGDRKKATWLASCPDVIDMTPTLESPKTENLRSPSGQAFRLLALDSLEFVSEPQSIIGCYVAEDNISDVNKSPSWQIGVVNRDAQGYYFKNAAGIIWRLTYNSKTRILETQIGSNYYTPGAGFRLDSDSMPPEDCKVQDYFGGAIRVGFPRNDARVKPLGVTKNLIIVVDFSDAPLTKDVGKVVDEVIAPRLVEKFFLESSSGTFKPEFELFPRIVRLESLEKSFAPNSAGGFFVNGVQQDHRLVSEAVRGALSQGLLGSYESVNVFAPTADSLGYYGSAHVGLKLDLRGVDLVNSQLISGKIGTVNSEVPSWKVFAHEYGHLLGMYDYYLPGTGSSGQSPGPFDIMGNTTGQANTFFGFQRWIQGWFDDSDVICDLKPDSSELITLSALNSQSGKRLYVHPLDGTTVMAIEFRTESQFDKLRGSDGLLVYTINMKVGSLKGPVTIRPSEQDLVLNPPTDVAKYATAPLSRGQSVHVNDFVVEAERVSGGSADFRILSKDAFAAKQAAEAKLAAELKAKLEAEAKAAAELKAKLVLEEKKNTVLPKVTTITCLKGKTVKRITALKPKCPAGYKIRK